MDKNIQMTQRNAANTAWDNLFPITHIKKCARFVIGTATAGWTTSDCDYLCDGTADQVEINAAITALSAAGGEIVILDGTYNITAKISVNKSNIILGGNGNATILKRMYDSTAYEGFVHVEMDSDYCKIRDFYIDGNKATYASSKNYGIYLFYSDSNIITGNLCYNNSRTGMNVSGNDNIVTGNICNNNTNGGIYLYGDDNIITGNSCNNNDYGIHVDSYGRNIITSNICYDNNYGISLSNSDNSNIASNICTRGTGLTTDYTAAQYTINLSGTGNNHNLISSNQCMGKDVVIGGGTSNTSVNNKFA